MNKWKYGMTYIGEYVNERTINYMSKYMNKIDLKHKDYYPIILCSKGIGSNYLKSRNAKNNRYNENNTNETYRTSTGHKLSLPIYYRNKIYNEEQREQLWLNKLDKEERYILGIKIDISKDEKNYEDRLNYARKINKELGYGSNELNNDEEEYKKLREKIAYLTYRKKIEKKQ